MSSVRGQKRESESTATEYTAVSRSSKHYNSPAVAIRHSESTSRSISLHRQQQANDVGEARKQVLASIITSAKEVM